MLVKGTLVRMNIGSRHRRDMVEKHGKLWVVTDPPNSDHKMEQVRVKSLVTGHHTMCFVKGVEVAKERSS